MMVTPQIRFAPETAVRPFGPENGRLHLSMDLQIPVAKCGEKKGSIAYANPVLLLVDPRAGLKSPMWWACSHGVRPGGRRR